MFQYFSKLRESQAIVAVLLASGSAGTAVTMTGCVDIPNDKIVTHLASVQSLSHDIDVTVRVKGHGGRVVSDLKSELEALYGVEVVEIQLRTVSLTGELNAESVSGGAFDLDLFVQDRPFTAWTELQGEQMSRASFQLKGFDFSKTSESVADGTGSYALESFASSLESRVGRELADSAKIEAYVRLRGEPGQSPSAVFRIDLQPQSAEVECLTDASQLGLHHSVKELGSKRVDDVSVDLSNELWAFDFSGALNCRAHADFLLGQP